MNSFMTNPIPIKRLKIHKNNAFTNQRKYDARIMVDLNNKEKLYLPERYNRLPAEAVVD